MLSRLTCTSVAVLLGVAVLALVSDGAAVDCRRFVFAPACRGATIKRSNPIAESIPSDSRLSSETDLFDQYQQQPELSRETDDSVLFNVQRAWPPIMRSNNRHRHQSSVQLDD